MAHTKCLRMWEVEQEAQKQIQPGLHEIFLRKGVRTLGPGEYIKAYPLALSERLPYRLTHPAAVPKKHGHHLCIHRHAGVALPGAIFQT